MTNYTIGCDAHKRFSLFAVMDHQGKVCHQQRVDHETGAIRKYLTGFPAGTPVAIESVGNWYWIVDEIEAAGCHPLLTNPAKAKVMMGNVNKTDKLDAQGLATLLHLGTLPSVWVPPGRVRDERELPRTRMVLTRQRAALKNRIHATLAKYNLKIGADQDIDIFAIKWRPDLLAAIDQMPPETQRCVQAELAMLEQLSIQIHSLEKRILEHAKTSKSLQLLDTLPMVAEILAVVIEREIGSIQRFTSAEAYANYAGTVPTVSGSAGKFHYGHLRKQANQYLKWAYLEAANGVARHHTSPGWRGRHVARLYRRILRRKGHAVAKGAVARHLAEATYWILTKQEPYREPPKRGSKVRASASKTCIH